MSLSIDSLSLNAIAASASLQQPRQAPVAPVGDREGANNDRRDSSKDARSRPSVAFRSFLNAATLAGLTKTLSADTRTVSTDVAPRPERPVKLPDQSEPPVISADEADSLYRSAQNAGEAGAPRAREFQTASSQYAKSFFAVAGTFARPGETLELTA